MKIEHFESLTKDISDSQKRFVFYKHMYLKCPFGDHFQRAIVKSAAILQKLTVQERERAEAAKAGQKRGDVGPGPQENDHKQKNAEVKEKGFFKSLIDKVDNITTSGKLVTEMMSKPKNTSRSLKELEEYYHRHLELFQRVGLIFDSCDDYEMQLCNREAQYARLQEKVSEMWGCLAEWLKERSVDLKALEVADEDLQSWLEVVVYSSLHLQESKVEGVDAGAEDPERPAGEDVHGRAAAEQGADDDAERPGREVAIGHAGQALLHGEGPVVRGQGHQARAGDAGAAGGS